MNRKSLREQQRRPRLLGALGGMMLLLSIVLTACSAGGSGKISADPEKIDYGSVKFGTKETTRIKVTNTGTGPLRFAEQPYIEVLEGCWPPDVTIGSMVLQPGESTFVESSEWSMKEGMGGAHDFAVHLRTNDTANPDVVVHVLSNWGP